MKANIELKSNELVVTGELNFSSVMKLWKKSLPLLRDINEISIDLAQVTHSNGAGLALLVEWLRYAKEQRKKINFKNMPDKLLSIARVSGIADLISVST
jgi:phospholipid transport system transporter-binding protein